MRCRNEEPRHSGDVRRQYRYQSTFDTPTGHECRRLLLQMYQAMDVGSLPDSMPEPIRRSCRSSVGLHSLSQWLTATQQQK